MSVKNYIPPERPENPFATGVAVKSFDSIWGSLQQQNRILRYVVIVACASFFLSIAISLYAVSRPQSIPVLVTMNDLGETHYVGEVSRKNYQNFEVPEIAIRYQVKEFISLYYSMSTDRTVMKKSLKKIYSYLTGTTSTKYSTMLKEDKPFAEFGELTREVFFQTEPLKLSKDSWQVDFQVVTRTLDGSITDKKLIRSVLSTKTLKPAEEDLVNNPLGIYITAFDMKTLNTNEIK